MIAIGTLAKLIKGGGMGMDELQELCSAAGIEIEISHFDARLAPTVLENFQDRTADESAKMFRLTGVMKSGEQIQAVFVLSPKSVYQKEFV